MMFMTRLKQFLYSRNGIIAVLSLLAIIASLVISVTPAPWWGSELPLWLITALGGAPLVWDIVKNLRASAPGADILAAISIIGAALLGEWMVAAIIVLMLSGGEALEEAASARASDVLNALARRAPSTAHRVTAGTTVDVEVDDVRPGDELLILPHEICPVDGEVVSGHGLMDESFLTGEPYHITKSVGSQVMSGAVNGDVALTVKATKEAVDSRYAQIVGVLSEAEANRPPIRRIADRLGSWYAAIALIMGAIGWIVSGDPVRFLAVIVIATPCPLLIGIPVAIIGAISLAARAGIIVKDPSALELIPETEVMMFDKTGTLTYGRPALVEVVTASDFEENQVLALAAALEGYSRHPLSAAIRAAAEERVGSESAYVVTRVSERPGRGLAGTINDHDVLITSRSKALAELGDGSEVKVPPATGSMECVVVIDGAYAATMRFRDEPRQDAHRFISHLRPDHGVVRTMLISGDQSSEVDYVAHSVGIDEVHAGCSPEEKLEIVERETAQHPTLFLGDGINDAPAMAAASVGVAFGANSDITAEAADAVVLDSSLERLDELIHVSLRMKRIAMQTAVGGMALSFIGMVAAVLGFLPPIVGAIGQEIIDIAAILNAARVAIRRKPMADF